MVRSKKYPRQIVLMISDEVGDLVDQVAETEGLHKTQVLRAFLHAGIKLAGYGDTLPDHNLINGIKPAPRRRTPKTTANASE